MTVLSSSLVLVMLLHGHVTVVRPASATNAVPSGSWNPLVNCIPTVVTIEEILGSQNNSQGGAVESGSVFNPGITSAYGPSESQSWLTASSMSPPGWVSPGPSCTVNNAQGHVVSAFVQINGVERSYRGEVGYNSTFMPINGGGEYSTGPQSDTTFNVLTPGYSDCTSTNTTNCMHNLTVVISNDWKAAGYCGPGTACDNNTLVANTGAYKTLIDVQGFLFWNPFDTNDPGHNYSGWTLQPLTAWRISSSSSLDTAPDYGLAASPSLVSMIVGQSASSTITVDTSNLFAGNVSFTAIISPSTNSSAPTPTAAITPEMIFIPAGGLGSSTLTVTTAPSESGNYSVTINGTSGNLTRMAKVSLAVTDFGIATNPAAMSVSIGSSSQSTISLTSINGFSGNVSLTAQVEPSSGTTSLSPSQPTAAFNASSINLSPGSTRSATLTVSASLLTVPGTYTVTVTSVSSGDSHTTTIAVTVTVLGL